MRFLPVILASLVLCTTGMIGSGRTAAAADKKDDRAGRLQEIEADYKRRAEEFGNALDAAETDAQKALVARLRPSDAQTGTQILALAKQAPADQVAFDGLVWIFSNLDSADSAPQRDDAVALFEKHHLKSPRLKIAIPALASCNSPKAEALLEKLAEKGESRDIRGLAMFRLALGKYERVADKNDDQQLAPIESLLERAKNDFGDVQPDDEDRPIAELAEPVLFEMRNLRPGKVVPEIAGTDVNGKPLKLSSFRGKVVLLVFWGSWCGQCMAQVPSEKKLMEKYAGKPFTIVGVNCIDTNSKAAATVKEQKMTWPSFVDGEDGPIATGWNISEFPSMYLIDAKGVIRLKNPQGEKELEAGIAKAVKEAKSP
jgi:thiol-disulfide isomerase/thioredoxin